MSPESTSTSKFGASLDRFYASLRRPGAILLVLIVSTFAVSAWLIALGEPLETSATPRGILDLELPWTAKRAQEVVNAWSPEQQSAAFRQTQVDFLYLLLYPLTLSLACWLLARALPQARWAKLGRVTATLALVAGPLDALENVLILRMLGGNFATLIALATSLSASAKFGLVFLALGFLTTASIRWLQLRIVPQTDLNQVTLPASDLARSVEFYRSLGLPLIVASVPSYVRFECPDVGLPLIGSGQSWVRTLSSPSSQTVGEIGAARALPARRST